MTIDPVDLTARLVRCPSITPEEGGALQLLDRLLSEAGFRTVRVDRGGTPNLFARWGDGRNGRSFGFNGHTDVVPTGPREKWSVDPFGAEIIDGYLYGRGATDMKSGVAAFVAAAIDFVRETPPDGSVVITVTGDEEGGAEHGTVAILDWMDRQGERMDVCLVGEPTCPERLGDMMKIGRRGSLTAFFTATGVQGHSAYPHRAKNPLHALVALMGRLTETPLDAGTDHFDPSTLQITTIDAGNPATNVIPGSATATVNIRYNDLHSGESLTRWLDEHARAVTGATGVGIALRIHNSGESFLTPPGDLSDLIAGAVREETGLDPVLSTSGGTSDARFVKDHCPVVEFGLVGERMHAVDERVAVDHVHRLKAIYRRILTGYFA
ncbi:succinyl-diaminopimelate desuccinylase [Halovulum dunhuangense]|uniref:Succinyl-diaminopimelate desuccinylase n=1 Tax=Halovulum dunhuangense TaxID=1505036 RepID=A0A849L625_9RHOB|nr:succinyl-diaminopimelate desuccinylase [Halovulum dunhuangense]NNU81600.1 succinyl-diaminopimelate desuccinylase [Halovulum dunhuangense]